MNMKKHRIVLLAVSLLLIATGALAQEISRLSAQFKNFDGSETTTNVAATGSASVPGTGGALAYSKAVFVPFLSGGQVLYVTISAVGDNHNGESNFISCNIDGPGGVGSFSTVCNPTATSFGFDLAPPGWIGLTHHFSYEVTYTSNGLTGLSSGDGGGGTSDEHDNAYYYTWCKRVSPGTHTVNLRLGNHTGPTVCPGCGGNNNNVFFEKAFFYIDVSATPPFAACSRAF
jgi:hypothetical protein